MPVCTRRHGCPTFTLRSENPPLSPCFSPSTSTCDPTAVSYSQRSRHRPPIANSRQNVATFPFLLRSPLTSQFLALFYFVPSFLFCSLLSSLPDVNASLAAASCGIHYLASFPSRQSITFPMLPSPLFHFISSYQLPTDSD